ncbi:MAG: macro domain-containing protein [Chloroflexota bacterium]
MQIILCDLREDIVEAWQLAFYDQAKYPNIDIYHGSIFNVDCDALVSPANSYGFMDGGIDMAISRHFGWHVQDRVQEAIRTRHHGELLVGAADIVATDDAYIPYVISAPTMRVPMLLGKESVAPYLATRAVLLLMKHGTIPGTTTPISDVVHQVAFPGMGTGVGMFPPKYCAKQMKKAVDDVVLEKFKFPSSWLDASAQDQLLYGDSYRYIKY